MRLVEGLRLIRNFVGIRFGELFSQEQLKDIIRTKGKSGVLLEKIIELTPHSHLHDFEDGELKTNKCTSEGKPLETMFITQIATHVDELLNVSPFEDSWLYQKIKNILYVPIAKDNVDPREWFFLEPVFVDIENTPALYKQLKSDYVVICEKMNDDIENGDGFLHTSSGEFIQIRTKDAKPYTPIYSKKYKKEISNKYFAFYFKKEFMLEIRKHE